MILDRLNYWRTQRGYSIRKLAEISELNPSTILYSEKHYRPALGKTARSLAKALGVEVSDLHTALPQASALAPAQALVSDPLQEPATQEEAYKKHTAVATDLGPVPTRGRLAMGKAVSFWVIENDPGPDAIEPFRLDTRAEAERLCSRLGAGRARVYEGTSKSQVWEQHRAFLVRVNRGQDIW